jgi:hypothetical protein
MDDKLDLVNRSWFETSPLPLVVGLVNYFKGKSMASWMEETGLTIW